MSEDVNESASENVTSNLPVSIQEQLRKELANLSNQVEPPSSNKISTKGKVFTLPDGRSSPGPIRVIVLDFVAINMTYGGPYNPNVRTPPSCWAIGKDLKTMAPSKLVPKPQSPSCDVCAQNQWGSGAGGNGKACKNQRRLLVIPPDFADGAEPMSLYVSPTGLKGWNRYIDKDLRAEFGVLPIQVVSDIGFDPNQAYPTLTFKYVGKHGDLERAMALRAKYADILWKEPEARAA